MKLLDSKLFEFLIFVNSSKETIDIESDNGYFDINNFLIQLEALDEAGLIKIKSCFIDYSKGSYFEDFFLSKFSKLIFENKKAEAKKFAKLNNIPEIFETVDTKFKNIQALSNVLDKVYEKIETSVEEFGKEIDYNTKFTLIKTQKLNEYITKYLNDFRNDLLEEESYSKDHEAIFGPKSTPLRYFKQKEHLITAIKQKLDRQKPNRVIFKLDEGYPSAELLEALIMEGYINSYEEEDIDDGTFLGIRQLVLDVNEDKILTYQIERKTDNNQSVKFDAIKSVLLFDKAQVKVRKFTNVYHILKYLFSRSNFYDECLYDELNDELDAQKKLNRKKMYDALYQFNERLSKVNKQDFLILTLQSVAINPKYKNEV